MGDLVGGAVVGSYYKEMSIQFRIDMNENAYEKIMSVLRKKEHKQTHWCRCVTNGRHGRTLRWHLVVIKLHDTNVV